MVLVGFCRTEWKVEARLQAMSPRAVNELARQIPLPAPPAGVLDTVGILAAVVERSVGGPGDESVAVFDDEDGVLGAHRKRALHPPASRRTLDEMLIKSHRRDTVLIQRVTRSENKEKDSWVRAHWSTNRPGVVGWNTVGSGILVRFALKTARGPGMCGGSIGAGTETKVNIV